MTLPNQTNSLLQASSPSGYQVKNSLRFRSSASANLSRTPSVAGNRQTWTYSAWVKRGQLGTYQGVLAALGGTAMSFGFFNSDQFYMTVAGISNPVTTAVFRDPSSWYHVVIKFDTTQATAANRVLIYINNVNYPLSSIIVSQNTNYEINNTTLQDIGATDVGGSRTYFDGYMAEVNFIDGQALTPSSFGAYNAYGVWQPALYTGTYGTNGFYLPFINQSGSTYAGYFGASQQIGVPASSAFNFGPGNFTVEAWINSTGSNNCIYDMFPGTLGSWLVGYFQLTLNSSSQLAFQYATGASSYGIVSSTVTIPAGQWSHVAAVRSGSTITLYLNGISIAATTFAGQIGTSGSVSAIGNRASLNNQPFTGSISNVRLTNTAVYTAAFVPPSSNLTNITGTALLTLQNATLVDNSSNAFMLTNTGTVVISAATPFMLPDIAADASGNANNWTLNNISVTAGTTYDPMLDSPTLTSATVANYAVLNPLAKPSTATISDGNLKASFSYDSSPSYPPCASTIALPSSGKWYAEFFIEYDSNGATWVGVCTAARTGEDASKYRVYQTSNNGGYYGYYSDLSSTNNNGNLVGSGILSIAVDMDTGKFWAAINNTWQGGGSPPAGTSAGFTDLAGQQWYMFVGGYVYSGSYTRGTANFGQRPFTYTPPTGFVALNTYNLPAPAINNGASYMAATTYTGTGAVQSISDGANTTTNVVFKPDFVWLKDRTNANSNYLFDSIRGATNYLISNATTAETTAADTLTSFNSNGFSLGTSNSINTSASNYIGWQWQAGQGSTSTNTNGTITSTVSVNATAGFSVVTYTGTGSAATVGHGLGVAPSMLITKPRNNAAGWAVYHVSTGNTGACELNTTNAFSASPVYWNNTSPTSSVFSVLSGTTTNTNGYTYVAYCWAAVPGYSAFGSYTGNGSSDGPFIYCGFRPRFILIKWSSASGANWRILDTSRNTYNVESAELYPSLANAEVSFASLDGLSNGFKIRNTDTAYNNSGSTYIYAAFAENPFKYALAR